MGILLTLNRIEKDSVKKLIEKIENSEEDIILHIHSGGGSVAWAQRLFEAIRNSKYPVTGVVSGTAESAAVYVLQACETRIATFHSAIRFHSVTVNKEYFLINEKLLKTAERQETEMARSIAERSKIGFHKVINLMRKNKRFFAPEALKYGLIDKIVEKASKVEAA